MRINQLICEHSQKTPNQNSKYFHVAEFFVSSECFSLTHYQ